MKKEELPQDMSALGRLTNEVCYVTDGDGKYTTSLSKGWEVKVAALDITWEDIQKQIAAAKQKVLAGQASPLHFWITLRMMEISLVAAYTGFRRGGATRIFVQDGDGNGKRKLSAL